MRFKFISFSLIAIALGLAAVSFYDGSGARAAASGGEPPPMPVKVITVRPSEAPLWNEYAGRVIAVDQAEIRPQVSGVIKEIKFKDGQSVKKGDVLFVIDPAPFEAALQQAQADLATAQSQNELAQKELLRAEGLLRASAISQTLMDERASAASVAKNAIASAQAKLRQAKIDLDYAYVKAPIAGQAGRAEITEGNLVQSGQNAPLLTTIVANDSVYADFDVDEQTYMNSVRKNQPGELAADQAIPVQLNIKGDDSKTYKGSIHSFDNRINIATGTIRARALFQNEDGALLPGMYVSVKMGSVGSESLLIPERAIGTDQDRKFVYVVGVGGKVEYRPVRLGAGSEDQRVVLDGLKAGDKVIAEGVIKIHPGMVVAPQEEAPPPAAEKPAAASPAPEDVTESPEKKPDEDVLRKVEGK